jgi:glycosyltransferase involved in cell wall biosynthesis
LKKKINILYIYPIHQFSGSLKSLQEYLKILPKKKYNFYFIAPFGKASKILSKFGLVVKTLGITKFDNTSIGHYRGARWLILIREIFYIFPTLYSCLVLKIYQKKIDIIHLNDSTALPIIFFLKIFYNSKIILHVRSVLKKKDNCISGFIFSIIEKYIDKIIVIDNTVKNSLKSNQKSTVIRNIIVHKKNIKKKGGVYLKIGYIGSLLKFKGVEDLIFVTQQLINEKFKIKLYLAGNKVHKNYFIISKLLKIFNINNDIYETNKENNNIIFMQQIDNIEKFYEKIDVLVFPSYINALGRSVFEAGCFSIPSIVCLDKRYSDSFIKNYSGLSFSRPGDRPALRNAIKFFYNNRKIITKMGINANKIFIKNFSPQRNLHKLEKIYKELS